MKSDKYHFIRAGLAAICVSACGWATAQASYPERPIRLVVGFAAGSTSDMVARAVVDQLAQRLGQPVVIENKPGAGGNIAAEAVAQSKPDGYTLLLGTSALSTNAALRPGGKLLPARDLDSIAILASTQSVLTVSERMPFKDYSDFVRYAKEHPGAINYGSSGVGGGNHLMTELLSQEAGIKLAHIPFAGNSQANAALLGGTIDVMFDTMLGAKQTVSTGKVRAVGITGSRRSPHMPGVPTFVELGVNRLGFDYVVGAILAPKGTPAKVLDLLHEQSNLALQEPAVKKRLEETGGLQIGGGPREKFIREMKSDTEMWSEIVKSAGIKAD